MLFFEIVQQKYGSGYGLRYGEGFYADSPDFLTSDARKRSVFAGPAICPVGEEMIEDFKKRWDEITSTYPDPEFRKELVKMESELAKSPSAFPILYMVCYTTADEKLYLKPMTRDDHNAVILDIIKQYNEKTAKIDTVYVDSVIEDDNIYNPEKFPSEIPFEVPDEETGEMNKIPCRVFHSFDESRKMLLEDSVFDVDKFNEKKKRAKKKNI